MLGVSASPAHAAILGDGALTANLPWGIAAVGFVCAAVLALKARRSGVILQTAKRKLGEVEYQLNEAEAAMQAESQVLITWSMGADVPERMMGTLHGIIDLPKSLGAIMDFAGWLEQPSSLRIWAAHHHRQAGGAQRRRNRCAHS